MSQLLDGTSSANRYDVSSRVETIETVMCEIDIPC